MHSKKTSKLIIVLIVVMFLIVSGILIVFVPYKHIKIDKLNIEGTDFYFLVDVEYWAFQGINLRIKNESKTDVSVVYNAFLLYNDDGEWKPFEHENLEIISLMNNKGSIPSEYDAKVVNFFGVLNRFTKYQILFVVRDVNNHGNPLYAKIEF